MAEGALFLIVLAATGGFIAGAITSVVGFGGGLVLVAMLSTVVSPHEVVALTAPVLMLGNVHRSWIFRSEVDPLVLRWFVIGAIPATLAGAMMLPQLPADGLRFAMGLFLVAFVIRETITFNRRRTGLPLPMLGVAGLANGGVSATIGGGGPLSAPFLHAYGLVRGAFIGTESAGSAVVQGLKSLVFAVMGLLTIGHLPASVIAVVSISVGNRAGQSLLMRVSDRLFQRMLLAMLILLGIRLMVAAA